MSSRNFAPTPRRWILKILALLLATAHLTSFAADPNSKLIAYVGTFSSPLHDVLPTQVDLPPGSGRGIHIFQVNRTTGALTSIDVHEQGTSPSCLALDKSRTHLYSANETDRVGDKKEGSISAFAINPHDGRLKLLNTVPSGGAGPTYVSVHPSGKFLLVANYFGGSVAVLPINADGSLAPASDIQIDTGKIGPTHATHAPPGSFAISGHDRTHAHMIASDPTGRFVFHADNALDKIFIWKFDAEKGALHASDPAYISFPPGDGPRHFVLHPNGQCFYSLQEESSTVEFYDFDSKTGRTTPHQIISTLPARFTGSSFASEILISPDAKFLYTANRLHDSIAIFSISDGRARRSDRALAAGDLTYLGEEWSRGNYPRSFNFDPTGNFLYCCNQRADHVTSFRINKESGQLTFTGQYVPVGNPSMIVFVELPSNL